MEEVRKRVRHYIVSGVMKTEGIKKLKREPKIPERNLSEIWIEEKEKLENKKAARTPKSVKTVKPVKTKNDRKLIFDKAFKLNGIEMQLTVAIEELAELQQALCKYKRGEKHNVEEEIADVKIIIEQLEMLFDKNVIERWKNKKVARLNERLSD